MNPVGFYISCRRKVYAIVQIFFGIFYLVYSKVYAHSPQWLQKIFSIIENYLVHVKTWLLTPVPRWRTIVATTVFIAIMTVTLLYGAGSIFAATYTFNQTTWNGGQSGLTMTHPTDLSGWTKYSAINATDTTGTPGSIKISSVVGTFTEPFSSTTYKDASATTALWDTSAQLVSNPTIISGTLYGTDEATPITGAAKTVNMKNGSQTVMTTESNSSDGTFSFSIPYNQLPASGDIITIWIDGETEDGSLVFRYGSSCTGFTDCTGLSIYQNQVIFSSYDGSGLIFANLQAYDNDNDPEVGFTANSTTLALSAGRTFRIKDSSAIFTQGSTITAPAFKQSAGVFTGATQAITISGAFTLSGTASFTSTSNTLTVTNAWTSNSGSPSFTANSGMVNFNLAASSLGVTLAPGTILFNNVTITNNSWWNSADYHSISGTMSVEGSLTLTQGGGCCSDNTGNLYSGTIQVKGDITIGANFATGVIGGGTTTIELIGTTDQTITGSSTGYAPSVKINKVSGAVILSGTINVSANWTWTSGPTLTAGSSTLIFYAKYGGPAATITPGSLSYNNVSFYIQGHYQQINNKTISGTLDVNGNLYLHEVAYNTTRINGGTITVAGNYTIDAASGTTFSGGTTAVTLDGTGAQTISVNGPGAVTNLSGTLTINKASGTATLGTNFTPGGAMTLSDGTFSLGASKNLIASTLTINGANAVFDPGSGTSALTATTLAISNGTFTGGANTMTITTFNQTGGAFTATSGIMAMSGAFTSSAGTFTHASGTVRYSQVSATMTGSPTLYNLTFNNANCCSNYIITVASGSTITVAGTLTWDAGTRLYTVNTGTIAAQGDIALGAASGSGGTGTLLINGPGDQTISGAGYTPNVNINKPSGTLTITGTVLVGGNWTYTAGTIAGTGTVKFKNISKTITGSHTLPNITFENNDCCSNYITTIASGTTVTVTGTTTWATWNTHSQNMDTGTLAAQGDIVVNTSSYYGTGTLLINGTGDQTISGTGITPNVQINKPSGTLTISGTVTVGGNWTYTAGTIAGTGTVKFLTVTATITGSHTLPNLLFDNGSCCTNYTITIAGGTTVTISGDVTWGAGTRTMTLNGGTLVIQGNLTVGGAASGGTTAIQFTGANAQTITHTAGTIPTGGITINKTNSTDTVTLASNVSHTGTLTITKGILDQGASYNLTSGAVTVDTTGTWTNTGTGDITLSGNVTNSGVITLDGSGATCGGADAIAITTSSVPTTRSWSGTGTFTLWDLTVSYMTGSRTYYDSTAGTGTTWTLNNVDPCTTGMIEGPYFGKGPSNLDNIIQYALLSREALARKLDLLSDQFAQFAYGVKNNVITQLSNYSNFVNTQSDNLYAYLNNNINKTLAKVSDYSLFANNKSDALYAYLNQNVNLVSVKMANYSRYTNVQSDNFYAYLNQNINNQFSSLRLTFAEFFKTEKAFAAANVAAQSTNISSGATYVTVATLTATATLGTGTATYYLSNDGGTNFFQVTSGSPYTFAAQGNGDLRWKAVLTLDARISQIAISYNYFGNVTLTSNVYDSLDATNIVTKLDWVSSGETGTDLVKLQIRTSADGLSWSGWCGPGDTGSSCSGNDYFLAASNGSSISTSNPLRSGGNDRYFQYLVTLVPGGLQTATLSDITITFVVNAPPEFNTTGGLTVSQVSDSTDAEWGKVKIDYSIRDPDTSTGTTTPGFVTPSFQYNIGAGWVSITSGNLSANATANKTVNNTSYSAYTAYWNAPVDIPENYLTTTQLRVTLNDNEGANNLGTSTSANFTLDTKVPAISAFTFDSTTDTLTLTSTDDSVLQYRISNNSNLSADGVNATSGAWQSPVANSISLTPSWIPTGSPSYENIYVQVRDIAGNVSSPNIVTPSTPGSVNIQDISNVPINVYKEFLSWAAFVPTTGSTFANYKIYRSTDNSTYSLLSTITDVASNSYFDSTVSANQTYYYKIKITDTNNDVGNFSAVVDDKVDGQGGTDVTPPVISAVTVSESQVTYVTVTWTTDELSNSVVEYSVSPSTAFGSTKSVSTYVTSHSVTVTDLTPSTTYLFRVKSTDIIGNTATNDNSGAGFIFTAGGGPIISNVTEKLINEASATITWNTNTDSNSYVSYSINSNLSGPSQVGSAALVGGSTPFQHTVTISGLTQGTKYYYFVESTDGSSNYSKDTNSGNYYSFTTTNDSKAPVISGVSAPVTSRDSGVVVWQTDEPATTQVEYGTASGTFTKNTTLDSDLSTFHMAYIPGLQEQSKYYYRVKSADAAGNSATGDENNFTTDFTQVIGVYPSGGKSTTPDTTPPVINNIRVENIKPFSAFVKFDISEDSVTFVDYGLKPSDLDQTNGNLTFSTQNEIHLSGLQMGKDYTFIVKAIDKAGNTTTSVPQSFTTTFFTESSIQIKDAEAFQKEIQDAIESALPSLVPPFVSRPTVSEITATSAKVNWKTNIKSYGSVAYVEDESFDVTVENPYNSEAADTTVKVIDHEILLTNLKPDTAYHIMARSFSLAEVVGTSADVIFSTLAPSIEATVGNVTNDSFKATWNTSNPTTSVVEYKNLKTGVLGQKSSEVMTKFHDLIIDNLTPGTPYLVNVYGINERGNKVSIAQAYRITTSIDTKVPTITSLTIDSALIPGRTDITQTIVSWKTDEPSTSTVYFKEGSIAPGETLTNKVEQTNNLVLDHAVVVSSLKPGGLYSIQVSSTDAAGNAALFPVRTAVIPQQGQSVVEIIFKNFEDTFKFLK